MSRRSVVTVSIALMLLLAATFGPLMVQAQESPITAEVDGDTFSTDDLVTLTVTVIDNSAQQPLPILPNLDGLAVVDLDISTTVDLIDGEIHTEVTYTYFLQPRQTGRLTIPPVTVQMDGQTYRADPIAITVEQGNAPAPSPGNLIAPRNIAPPAALDGQDFFVEAVVDNDAPYTNQQIIYTFRLYQAIKLYDKPQYDAPRFDGFDELGLAMQQFNLDVAGQTYLVTELRTALFPQEAGLLIIDAARLMIPGNFYEDPVEMFSDPLTIEVKPLPDDAPFGFRGAVGQFQAEAWFSPQATVVNQPARLYVAITGTGNIKSLPEPIWPPLPGWNAYGTLTSLTTDPREDGQIAGTRVFERLVVPNQEGEQSISAATFIYFDPTLGEYKVIETEPVSVRVIPAPTPGPTIAAPAVNIIPTSTPAALAEVEPPTSQREVNPSITVLPDITPTETVLGFLLLGMCLALPMMALVGAGGFWWWQQRQQGGDLTVSALKQAITSRSNELASPKQQTHPALLQAMRESDDTFKVVDKALTRYLSHALKTPINGLTRTELNRLLHKQGLDKSLIRRVEDVLAQSELGRFAPDASDDGWPLIAEAEQLLADLDRVFAPPPKPH